MNLEYYAKIVNAVDEVRGLIGDEIAEILISTLERSYNKIEDYCKINVGGFSQNGVLVPKITYEDGVLTQEIDLKINGKSVEDEKYAIDIAKILQDAYNEVGWEIENED